MIIQCNERRFGHLLQGMGRVFAGRKASIAKAGIMLIQSGLRLVGTTGCCWFFVGRLSSLRSCVLDRSALSNKALGENRITSVLGRIVET